VKACVREGALDSRPGGPQQFRAQVTAARALLSLLGQDPLGPVRVGSCLVGPSTFGLR